MIQSQNRSRVIIPHDLINNNPDMVAMCMKGLIVIDAHSTAADELVYTVIDAPFSEKPLAPGAIYPIYQCFFSREEGVLTYRWESFP